MADKNQALAKALRNSSNTPQYIRGDLLPFKKDIKTKEVSFGVPNVLQGLIDAASAPYRAMRGEIDVDSPQGVQEALNVALNTMGGGFAANLGKPAQAGVLGMHIPTSPSKPLPEGVGKTFERTQVKELLPIKDLRAEDIHKASVFTFPADSTSYGLRTESISGNKIAPEFQQTSQGGIPFGRSVENQEKDIGFASNESAATGQQNRYELERQANLARGGSGRIFVAPTTMAPFSEGFSSQPVFLLDSLVKSQGHSPSYLSPIDDKIRNTTIAGKKPFANWVGLADPSARNQLLTGEGIAAGKADLKKLVYEKYRGKLAQKLLDYNAEDLQGALLDPRLHNAPSNHLGELWYEVNFNKGLTPSKSGSGHFDYSHDMPGNYAGTTQLKPTGEVFGQRFEEILSRIPKIDKNGKQIPEATRQLNAINVLRSQKENAHLFVDDSELERLKRLFQL